MKDSKQTREGLNARLIELNQNIRSHLDEQEALALKAAEGDTEAPKKLADNYAVVNRATNERRAVEQALRALDKRDFTEDMQARLAAMNGDREAAYASVKAVRPALDRVAELLTDLGEAWSTLQTATQGARAAEKRLRGETHDDRATGGVASVFPSSLSVDPTGIVSGLLWRAIGDSLVANADMREAQPAWLDKQIAKALQNIDDGLRRREQFIREQLGQPAPEPARGPDPEALLHDTDKHFTIERPAAA